MTSTHESGPAGAASAPGKGSPLGSILRGALGLLLLGFILYRIDLSELAVLTSGPALLAVGAAFLLLVLAQLFSAIRWRAVMGLPELSTLYLFRLYLVGQFFSLFLPTSIGGDAVRAVAVARATGRSGEAVTGVALDRGMGVSALFGYLVLGAAALPAAAAELSRRITFSVPLWPLLVAGAMGAVGAGIFYMFRHRFPRITALLTQGIELVLDLARSPGRLVRIVLLSFLVQGIYIVVWYAIAVGLGLDVDWLFFVFAVPVVSLVAMLPVSISGVGLREGTWVLLLAPFGVSAGLGVALGLGYLIAFTALAAAGGIWFSIQGTAPAHPATPGSDPVAAER